MVSESSCTSFLSLYEESHHYCHHEEQDFKSRSLSIFSQELSNIQKANAIYIYMDVSISTCW